MGMGDDELYALRQARWCFRWCGTPPGHGLAADVAARLQRGLLSLQKLWDDVRQRPLAASLERFIEATGLAAHASIGTAGSSRAGNLLRLLAMVRDAQSRRGLGWAEITDELRDLLEDDRQRIEEMTLETGRPDVVRVMNLHQAKGLEAKVVFLADAFDTSSHHHPVDVHVSRVAEIPYLSMAVTRRARFNTTVLAEPKGWEQDAAEEARYLAAESLRLVYVAATRARDVLVLGTTAQSRGAWSLLEPAAVGAADLPRPMAATTPSSSQDPDGEAIDVAAQRVHMRQRWAQACKPSHAMATVTDDEQRMLWDTDAEVRGRGRHYGTVVHRLFESALLGRLGNLDEDDERRYVQVLLAAGGLDSVDAVSAAQRALAEFRGSDIWQEVVRAAADVFVEVPIASAEDDAVRRGVIDLVYRIEGGWKIIDYKTHPDLTAELTQVFKLQINAYAAHWEAVSGAPVAERGLWLATSDGTDRYVELP